MYSLMEKIKIPNVVELLLEEEVEVHEAVEEVEEPLLQPEVVHQIQIARLQLHLPRGEVEEELNSLIRL